MDQCVSELVTCLESMARTSGRLARLDFEHISAIDSQGKFAGTPLYRYRAFGLNISSELPLPELSRAEGVDDIAIRLGLSIPRASRLAGNWFSIDQRRICISYEEEGDFLLEGDTIRIGIPQRLDARVTRRFLLGRIMAVVLHERGHLLLHGSAVAIDGVAMIFLGKSGSGKSTLAAALYQRGHELLTDDLAVVGFSQNFPLPVLSPAFPQIKLCPDAARHLCGENHNLKAIDPWVRKFELLGARSPAADSFPVGKIFLLEDGFPLKQHIIAGHEAAKSIVCNVYPSHLPIVHAQDVSSVLAAKCVRMAHSVSVAVLTRPRVHSSLDQTCRFIERSMGSS